MNKQEQYEFEGLKTRHAYLLSEVNKFSLRLEAFEQQQATAQTLAVPVPPPVVPAQEVAQVQAPAVEPPLVIPQPIVPPLAPAAPPLIPRLRPLPRVRLGPPKETPPVAEPVFSPAQSSAAPATEAPAAPAKKGSFEMRLGTYWLVRIGIVMLLTSLVFFGNYAYQNFVPRLGPAGKVTLLYLASGALLAAGTWFQRKQETLKNYAQVLQAGGLAAVYFTTYAAHHFANLQIIRSAVVDGVLLLGWTAGIVWLADRKKSEVLALFAVLLAYYTSVITHAGLFTLYSNLLLTVAAVFFLVRNRWATLSFASLVATYASYAFWRFFQAGEWQGAATGESLWTGNYFLAGYWLLFTAAAFLSRHEQFNGGRRATFLSCNNGAFFSTFVLTMVQAHQGDFWKFSLIYGAVLLGLAVLARKALPADKLFCNTYLTQGLLLVTLGFITHVTGFKLSILLAVESVILLTLGQQMQSRVMQAGSIIAASLAVGWAAATIQPFDRNGLLTGAAVGMLMLFNAFWLRNKTNYAQSALHPRTVFYTTIALATWLLTTWDNTGATQRGLIVACESVAFLLVAQPLGNRVLQFGSYLFAGVSLGWEVNHLGGQFLAVERAARIGLWPGIAIGALLVFNALWEKHQARREAAGEFHPPATFFSALGMLVWLLTTAVFAPPQFLAPLLAGEALVLTAAYYPLRLKETAVFGQGFLLVAQSLWLAEAIAAQTFRPWWNPAAVIAITLALAAWWQRQKAIALKPAAALALQGVQALAVVGLLYFWLAPRFNGPSWLAFTSLLAILLTAYAALNRFWLLAAAGQIFLLVSGVEFFRQLSGDKPDWYWALAPIAALALLAFCAGQWFARKPEAADNIRGPILGLGRAYHILALVMSLWWIHQYIPARQNVWVLSALGLALFLAGGWRRNRETLIFGAVFTATGLVKFWVPLDGEETVYWANLLAILVLLAQQQLSRHPADKPLIPARVHTCAIVAGGLSLWLFVSRWILLQWSGFYLTAGWSALALVLFVAGMGLRERVYRWLGLAVLACALGRVVVFDVWKLETIYRILSFMALGVVLLVLGFIYNRFQEKIKEWL